MTSFGVRPYPESEPNAQRWSEVGDGHSIYWEVCGNDQGTAAARFRGTRNREIARFRGNVRNVAFPGGRPRLDLPRPDAST